MTILDTIVENKKIEVAKAKEQHSIKELEQSKAFGREVYSARESILSAERSGIIAEFKRKSPSKGIINDRNSVEEVTTGYAAAGASCLSVLTDQKFFGGCVDDLLKARAVNTIPVLRKDFIVDEYQIVEAKSIGADLILLIAACLTKDEVKTLAACAKSLGLEVLMEVHNREELDKCCLELDVVGVNNRNLKDFTVDIRYSMDLFHDIPSDFVRISESGIGDPASVAELKEFGFDGFLMGEAFMKTDNPPQACKEYIKKAGLL